MNEETKAQFITLIQNREFDTLVEETEEIKPYATDIIIYLKELIKESSDDDLIAFFEYVETISTYSEPEYDPDEEIDYGKHCEANYDNEDINQAQFIKMIIDLERFGLADILINKGYEFNSLDIKSFRFRITVCVEEEDEEYAEDAEKAKRLAMWLVTRGNLTWDKLPQSAQ